MNQKFVYTYDNIGRLVRTGTRVGMSRNGYMYYYIYNLQGDVIALARATTGNIVATYSYDAWGNCTVNELNGYTVGSANPFRYRSYYYDSDTGLYYLNSRYYDAETGRFINADAFATTDVSGVLSANMFAYCENNPIVRSDPSGELWNLVAGAAVGAIIGGISSALSSYKQSGTIDVASMFAGAAAGAVSGLISASGLGAGVQALASGAIGCAGEIFDAYRSGRDVNVKDALVGAAIGAGSSLVGSFSTKNAVQASKNCIQKGINKVSAGKARYDSGSRYWKGSMKRGMSYIRTGVHDLNVAQGKASITGSLTGGLFSWIKTFCMN